MDCFATLAMTNATMPTSLALLTFAVVLGAIAWFALRRKVLA